MIGSWWRQWGSVCGEVCRRRRLVFYEIGQILMWAQHLYILYNLNVPPTGLAPLVHLPWLCYRMAHLTITNKIWLQTYVVCADNDFEDTYWYKDCRKWSMSVNVLGWVKIWRGWHSWSMGTRHSVKSFCRSKQWQWWRTWLTQSQWTCPCLDLRKAFKLNVFMVFMHCSTWRVNVGECVKCIQHANSIKYFLSF